MKFFDTRPIRSEIQLILEVAKKVAVFDNQYSERFSFGKIGKINEISYADDSESFLVQLTSRPEDCNKYHHSIGLNKKEMKAFKKVLAFVKDKKKQQESDELDATTLKFLAVVAESLAEFGKS